MGQEVAPSLPLSLVGGMRIGGQPPSEHLLSDRARALGVTGVDTSEEIGVVLDEACRDMSEDFNAWHKGLSADWAEQPAKRLAYAWKGRYTKNNLTDFLEAASKRHDLHGQSPEEWVAKLLDRCPGTQLRKLLGDAKGDQAIQEMPALIDHAMCLALEDRAAIQSARQWNDALAAGKTVAA